MVPETWDLQNVKILSIYLTMVSVPIFQHSLFPNYDLFEKKGTNVYNLAKIGLIFMNVSGGGIQRGESESVSAVEKAAKIAVKNSDPKFPR